MKKRILWNNIKGSRLMASVDTLMEKAQTPDFLQMHAGEISESELVRFAEDIFLDKSLK